MCPPSQPSSPLSLVFWVTLADGPTNCFRHFFFLAVSLAVDSEAETEEREQRRRLGRQGEEDRAERAWPAAGRGQGERGGWPLGSAADRGQWALPGVGKLGKMGRVEREAELSLMTGARGLGVSLGVWVWPVMWLRPLPLQTASPKEEKSQRNWRS